MRPALQPGAWDQAARHAQPTVKEMVTMLAEQIMGLSPILFILVVLLIIAVVIWIVRH